MSIIGIIIVLVVAGVVVYLLNTLVPMDPRFKTAINAAIGLALFIWVVSIFFPGVFGGSFNGCSRVDAPVTPVRAR
jgi:hypothetical protein